MGALACNTGPKGHDAGNFACNQAVDAGHVVPVVISEGVDLYNGSITGQVAATFNASSGDANHSGPKITHTASCIAFTQNARDEVRLIGGDGKIAGALSAQSGSHQTTYLAQPLPFDTTQISSPHNYSSPQPGDPCHPLAAGAHPPAVAFEWQREASQNMDFADNFSPALIKSQTPAVAYAI